MLLHRSFVKWTNPVFRSFESKSIGTIKSEHVYTGLVRYLNKFGINVSGIQMVGIQIPTEFRFVRCSDFTWYVGYFDDTNLIIDI